MTAYYNEIDPKAAAWLRELIKNGHIAPGDVDERSIVDVTPQYLIGYTQCHFFAGIGVWSHALRQAGWSDDRPVWTASCPCQPFSSAGQGKGVEDERHLFPVLSRLIAVRKPIVIFGEQVSGKAGLTWFDDVQNEMEKNGYAYKLLVNGDNVAKDYRVSGIPTLYVIGVDGKILFSEVGARVDTYRMVTEIIEKHLKDISPP